VAHEEEIFGKELREKGEETLPSESQGKEVRPEFNPALNLPDGMLLS
jgi:hypothetical protein